MNNTPKVWPWFVGVAVVIVIALAFWWSVQSAPTAPVDNQPAQTEQTYIPTNPTVMPATDTSATTTP